MYIIAGQKATLSFSSISLACQIVGLWESSLHPRVHDQLALKNHTACQQRKMRDKIIIKNSQNHHHTFLPITLSQLARRLPSHQRLPSLPILPHSLSQSCCVRFLALGIQLRVQQEMTEKSSRKTVNGWRSITHPQSYQPCMRARLSCSRSCINLNRRDSTVVWFNIISCTCVRNMRQQKRPKSAVL